MANPDDIAARIASSPWAEAQRKRGAVITIQGESGVYYATDPGFAPLIGRAKLERNGFDMIPSSAAHQGATMMAEHAGQPLRIWFPFKSDTGALVWARFETHWEDGMLACAIWAETDPARQHVHVEPL